MKGSLMSDESAEPAPQAPAAEPARDFEVIVAKVRAETIPGSPFSQDAAALAHLDFVFIPALIAAFTKG